MTALGGRFFYNTSIASASVGPFGYLQLGNIPLGTGSQNIALENVSGFNPTATTGFMQLFAKTIATLAAGDVPVLSFLVPGGASFAYGNLLAGLAFTPACCFAVSTTGEQYTPSADKWFLLAEGRLTS